MKFTLKFFYNIDLIHSMREEFKHKSCYKPKYVFLRIQSTPTIALTTRIMTHGKFLKLYRTCKKFYNLYFLKTCVKNLSINNEFKALFNRFISFRDFNIALFWKIQQIDCIFNVKLRRTMVKKKILKKKKLKKKNIIKVRKNYIYHITGIKRYLLVLKWLKLMILVNVKKRQNNKISLFKPIVNFLTAKGDEHSITILKLKVYKLKLIQLFR